MAEQRFSTAILVGGLGTRLRSVTGELPKVLAPIHGKPFLQFLLDQLHDAGVRDITLLVGYGAEQVRGLLGDRYRTTRLHYSQETTPLGTGGAIRLALPLLDQDDVLVLNGDSYCGIDFAGLYSFHRSQGCNATLSLVQIDDATRFGRVEIDALQRVIGFVEKSPILAPGWINAGVYFFRRSMLDGIPAGIPVSLERDVLPGQVRERQVYTYPAHGPFIDIGVPESYAAAERFFENLAKGSQNEMESE